MYARVHEVGDEHEDVMFEAMSTEQRVRTACKILGMALLGVAIGLMVVLVKSVLGMDRR